MVAPFNKWIPQDKREIIGHAFRASPREFAHYRARDAGDDYIGDDFEETPIGAMLDSSPAVNYARQILPNKAGDTEIVQTILDKLGADDAAKALAEAEILEDLPKSWRNQIANAPNAIRNLPLGGFSPKELNDFKAARAKDAPLTANTVEFGKVPDPENPGLSKDADWKDTTAQAAGVLGADMATDGARNIWWFLNAPQAITSLATQAALRSATEKVSPGTETPPPLLKNRSMRMAAAAPAWIGMSMAVGNFMRQPGYKAVVPDEDNPTETANPLAELGARYFLGRSGSLLPYDEFVKERPDVSPEEYGAYKSYLFGNPSPIKGTMDGIHGPEVNFMGKSIPLLTGILPAAATVYGTFRGARLAGMKLRQDASGDLLNKAINLRGEYKDAHKRAYAMERNGKAKPEDLRKVKEEAKNAFDAYTKQQRDNEKEVLKHVLANSIGFGAGASVLGAGLESIRRATDYDN